MKKKLIVAAVAGALAAPALALAQTSTVQIYGLFNVEYGVHVQNADTNTVPVASRHKSDSIQSGASRIGFKGEEKLGGGLSAWFQCETSVEFLAGQSGFGAAGGANDLSADESAPAGVWCDRNSALGLKGGWGSLYIGSWDSPLKQVTSATRMLNETGWFGAQRLLLTSPPGAPGVTRNYSSRNWNSVNYASPQFGGLTLNGQYTTHNTARNLPRSNEAAEWRHFGLNGIYSSGPLVVGVGWSKVESQFGVSDGTDDQLFAVGVNYTFGAFKLGGLYTQMELERGGPAPAAITEHERKSISGALEWKLGGPGMVRFGVTRAGARETAAPCGNCGSATQYQVSYNHSFSKRTTGTIGFVVLDNGSGGHYNLQGHSTGSAVTATNLGVQAGDKSSAAVLGLQHTF